jgi:4-alpha-glucanotransferase
MIEQDIGAVPMVAEDLGIITDEVRDLKRRHDLPGMSVLQFGFDEFDDNPHKPHNITRDSVVYTGTHDNNTANGWFASLTIEQQRDVRTRLDLGEDDDVAWSLIEIAMQSKACLAMVPMQDFLGLGEEARMNTPGTMHGNWDWIMPGDALSEELSTRIHEVISASGRLPDEQ